ncbi:hypothetical protein MJO28_013215 [Puccinia striiformis f. sp. tritici]|uniref:Uncharacterized protein n=1 Tax=Puccinia striiformis f. sp. tritici TaxID=168172 RepID=A0ACC0DYW9_9BASI|nr:hypothetical protein MJO28_013215 [Puccinia striiformis f. sp. tritici]
MRRSPLYIPRNHPLLHIPRCGATRAISREISAAVNDTKTLADRGPPMRFPAPSGHDITKEEAYIPKFDASTGAPLTRTARWLSKIKPPADRLDWQYVKKQVYPKLNTYDKIKSGSKPASDGVVAIPSGLGALCLYKVGLQQSNECQGTTATLSILTFESHAHILRDNGHVSAVGSTLAELVWRQPSLKKLVLFSVNHR